MSNADQARFYLRGIEESEEVLSIEEVQKRVMVRQLRSKAIDILIAKHPELESKRWIGDKGYTRLVEVPSPYKDGDKLVLSVTSNDSRLDIKRESQYTTIGIYLERDPKNRTALHPESLQHLFTLSSSYIIGPDNKELDLVEMNGPETILGCIEERLNMEVTSLTNIQPPRQ